MNVVVSALQFLQELVVVGSPAASSPFGRRLRVRRLVREGCSPERAWAVVITRDIERGETHFTTNERELAKKILKQGIPGK